MRVHLRSTAWDALVTVRVARSAQQLTYPRDDLRAVKADRLQAVAVRHRAVAVLQVEAAEPELAHGGGDLLRHGLRRAGEHRAVLDLRLEVRTRGRRPAPLRADPVPVGLEVREHQLPCLLVGLGD